jgi:hypothetical protein
MNHDQPQAFSLLQDRKVWTWLGWVTWIIRFCQLGEEAEGEKPGHSERWHWQVGRLDDHWGFPPQPRYKEGLRGSSHRSHLWFFHLHTIHVTWLSSCLVLVLSAEHLEETPIHLVFDFDFDFGSEQSLS